MMSGGRIDFSKFRRGWALPMGWFGKAHYWEREELTNIVRSRCGIRGQGGLFHVGDWNLCKRCRKSMETV